MTAHPIHNQRRTMVLWGGALLIGCLAVLAFNLVLMRQARNMRERDYRTYLAAAAVHFEQDDLPSAIRQVEEALRRDPDAPDIHVMAGHIEYRLKHWQPAVEAYHRAMAKGSPDEGIRLNTIWALIEMKQYDEAAAFGKRCIAQGITGSGVQRYVAEALFRAGKYAEAASYFNEALKGYPDDLYLLDHLMVAYDRMGDPQQAQAIRTRIEDVQAAIAPLANGQGVPQ